MTVVGYIGLGAMGMSMVERLVAVGHEVLAHDIDPDVVRRAVAIGATGVGTAREASERADVVSVCVPAAEHVWSVLHGPDGVLLAGGAAPVLVHSTIHPDEVTTLASDAVAAGRVLADCCVGGGAAAAKSGELVLFVGGLDALGPRVAALLDDYGTHVVDAGAVGAGAAVKLAFNVMTYAQFAAASAGASVVDRYGIAPEVLHGAWRHVGMFGALTERFAALGAMPADHLPESVVSMLRVQVGIARKDLDLAASLVDDVRTDEVLRSVGRAMATIYRVEETP